MTDDLKERLWEVFANVEARPKRRQGVTGMTIDAQMRGTMCQINEYELDVLRDAISDLEARLAVAEAGEDALAGALRHMVVQFQHPDQMADDALAAYDARRKTS